MTTKISTEFDKFLFWDINIDKLTVENDYFFIIKRIIIKGNKQDRIKMWKLFSKDKIRKVLLESREIDENIKEVYLMAIDE